MAYLSRSEEIVLLSVWRLQNEAYGVTIRNQVSDVTGRDWSIGALYAPLHRLEKKGYLDARAGEPGSKRGGRRKIYYQLTSRGKQALLDVKQVHDAIWQGIPVLAG
jgi:DNA-binding PadR family transcriptional regulator